MNCIVIISDRLMNIVICIDLVSNGILPPLHSTQHVIPYPMINKHGCLMYHMKYGCM